MSKILWLMLTCVIFMILHTKKSPCGLFFIILGRKCLARSHVTAIPCFACRFSIFGKSTPASAHSRDSNNLFSSSLQEQKNTHSMVGIFIILGRKDSNLRDGWTKTSCLTTWRRPNVSATFLILFAENLLSIIIFKFFFCNILLRGFKYL